MAEKAIPVAPKDFRRSESTRGIPLHENSLTPQKVYGNKCYHEKLIPKEYISPAHHKQKPWLIQKAQNGLFRYFFSPLKYLNIFHRSERREAIMKVGQCLLDYMDLRNYQVRPLTIESIARQTQLGYRRIQRAINELKEAGYIFVQRRWNQIQDKFIGLSSSITISRKLLYALGIKPKELSKYQRHKELESRANESEAQSLANFKAARQSTQNDSIYNSISHSPSKHFTEHIADMKRLLKIKL